MTKNKFVHPPYLPEYDHDKAMKLYRTLLMLSQTCCEFTSVEGAMRVLTRLMWRPSSIRKHDLYEMKPMVEAINGLKESLE